MPRHPNQPGSSQALCTWKNASGCKDCRIAGSLMCRFNTQDLTGFLIGFLPFGIAVIAGMLRGGYGWYLLGWLAFWIVFFFVWEARVLCSHCPYWAEEGRVLHCHANYGVIKIWRFHPEPMSKAEKAQFVIGVFLFVVYPFIFMLLGGQYLLILIALSAALNFGFSLKRNVCTRCINFSCPMNGVPKSVVDAYLRQNPVMLQAWEASGYRVGE
jgi:hypothetical protein